LNKASYSAEVKEYLCHRISAQTSFDKGARDKKINKCCEKAFVSAVLLFTKKLSENTSVLKVETDFFSDLLTYLLIHTMNFVPEVREKGRGFEIVLSDERSAAFVKKLESAEDLSDFIKCRECMEYFLKGAFLACGTVADPSTSYHLEFVLSSEKKAKALFSLLLVEDMDARLISRRNNFVVYIKGSERVSSFFARIGAQKYALDIIDKSIEKEIKNNVNRSCNCENANTQKTVKAYVELKNATDKIKEKGLWDTLSEDLREVATLRLDHPDASLSELCLLYENGTLSRSGINHRLRKIVETAKEL
jgi:DNA-binding protein WhiA